MNVRPSSWLLPAACALALMACAESAPTPAPVAAPEPETPAASAEPKVAEPSQRVASAAQKTPTKKPGATVANQVRRPKPLPGPPKVKKPEVPFEGRRIALVHTANVIGELEPCG